MRNKAEAIVDHKLAEKKRQRIALLQQQGASCLTCDGFHTAFHVGRCSKKNDKLVHHYNICEEWGEAEA